jgi:hypothetical protein
MRAKSQSMEPLGFMAATSSRPTFPPIGSQYPQAHQQGCAAPPNFSTHSIGSPPADPSPQQQQMMSPSAAAAIPFLNQHQQHQSSPQSVEAMILVRSKGVNLHLIPSFKEDDDPLGPLPDGWQKGVAPNGDPYFIDHKNKETTWSVIIITLSVFK